MDYSRLAWLVSSKWALATRPQPPPSGAGVGLVMACLDAMRTIATQHQTRLHLLMHRHLNNQPRIVDAATWDRFRRESGAFDMTETIRAADSIGYDGGQQPAGHHPRG
jgi:hypothetical protein